MVKFLKYGNLDPSHPTSIFWKDAIASYNNFNREYETGMREQSVIRGVYEDDINNITAFEDVGYFNIDK